MSDKITANNDFTAQVIIPFRLREGADMRRSANLETVMMWWWAHGFEPSVVDDGGSGDDQFNRHRAYNEAVSRNPDVDVFIFTEADMLIPPRQVLDGARMANETMGLVVPFLQYRYLSDAKTGFVRHLFEAMNTSALTEFITSGEVFEIEPESTMDGGRSIGAVNIVSRNTLERTGGFTEMTEGNWYDDRIIEEGFAYLSGKPTRYVEGPAVHLYHLPGWTGDHLTDEDRAATARNKDILIHLRSAIHMKADAEVRSILSYRKART
jgi:hypothetical protein